MIEQALVPGGIGFAILVSLMVISAGLAAFPPARDFRVFLGALIMGGGWVTAIAAAAYFDNWSITSSLFVSGFIGIGAFYCISRPKKGEPDGDARERNWAGYVAMVLVIFTAANIAHALSTIEFGIRPFVIVLLGAIGLIIFWGVARGFGFRAAIIFALLLLAINLMAVNFFLTISNSLTAIAFATIIWRGSRGAWKNLVSWTRAVLNRRKEGV
jgi:hypothetical protein